MPLPLLNNPQGISKTDIKQSYFYVITLLSLVLVSIGYAYLLKTPAFWLDDPYILLHNVQVLIAGHDQNYPDVNPLNGTTSLIHLALVRGFAYFLSPLWALYIVTWLSIFVYAAGLLRLAFIYSASGFQAMLCLITGLLIGFVPLHLLSGLETGLTLALLTWAIIFISTQQRIKCNLLLGLLPFVRPELVLFTVIFWLSRIFYYWRIQKTNTFVFWQLIYDLSIILLTALPFALAYFSALGLPFPQTLAAKRYFFAEQTIALYRKAFVAFFNLRKFAYTLGIVNFIGFLLFMFFTPLSRIFLLFLLSFFLLYLLVFPTALCFNYYRYLYILVPLMLYGTIACLEHPSILIKYSAQGFLYVTAFSALAYLPLHVKETVLLIQHASTEFTLLKNWCEKNLPPDTTIGIQDAGYLSYATPFHLVDIVGLKTPDNMRYHKTLTFPSAGKRREAAIAAIIRDAHLQYLIITTEWDRVFHLTQGLASKGIGLRQRAVISNFYVIYQLSY